MRPGRSGPICNHRHLDRAGVSGGPVTAKGCKISVLVGVVGVTLLLDHPQVGAGQINDFVYSGPVGALPTLAISGGSVDLSTASVGVLTFASITISGNAALSNTLFGSIFAETNDHRRQFVRYVERRLWARYAVWRARQ